MKVFSRRQAPTVVLIACLSFALSGAVLDKIPRNDNYKATIQRCDGIAHLFIKNTPACTQSTVTLHSYGRPFVAIRKPASGQDTPSMYVNSIKVDNDNIILLSLNSAFLITLSLTTYLAYSRYVKYKLGGDTVDSPLIAPSDMTEDYGLTSMAKGIMASYTYNLLTNSSDRVMLLVTLNNDTGIHVVATGSHSKSSLALSQSVQSKFLKSVELEGNYPQYFEVYCTPDKEIELLQIFDPSTMALLADFCRAYEFELFKDTLYISQSNDADDRADTTTMAKDAEDLLVKIGGTLSRLS